jgi:hypothetical protein
LPKCDWPKKSRRVKYFFWCKISKKINLFPDFQRVRRFRIKY